MAREIPSVLAVNKSRVCLWIQRICLLEISCSPTLEYLKSLSFLQNCSSKIVGLVVYCVNLAETVNVIHSLIAF